MTFHTLASHTVFSGRIFEVRREQVAQDDHGLDNSFTRDVVHHLDAVAVVAMREGGDIALIRQYRHPLKDYILELPAGLMDNNQERPDQTALRELQEETGLVANEIRPLLTIASSPGFTDELVEVYLATDLVEGQRPAGVDEEADIELRWVNLLAAIKMIRTREIISAHTVAGILGVFAEVYGDD